MPSSVDAAKRANNEHPIRLRFFLVRHGETVANVEQKVVGQSDSPLTKHGIYQVESLGTSKLHGVMTVDTPETFFWHIYASDLPRTQHTARLLLTSLVKKSKDDQLTDTDDFSNVSTADFLKEHKVLLDKRLREISKGARQGYPKAYSLQEAMEARTLAGDEVDSVPLLESLDDGFARIYEWWRQVIDEALIENKRTAEDDSCPNNQDAGNVRNILVVAHAGILRVFLQRLLGEERLQAHPDARYDPKDGRFAIPNASLTILEVDTSKLEQRREKSERVTQTKDGKAVQVLKLTDAQHYQTTVV